MNAYIKAISYYLPQNFVTNEDISKEFPKWTPEKIESKTGVKVRHVASIDETAGDMAIKAAKKLFVEYNIEPSKIDFILLCTQSADYKLPSTACIIQNMLGVPTSAGALDFDLGCSGFEYGLAIAKGLIVGKMAKNVLLLTAETYNKYIHSQDFGNRTIFGDGAAATIISTEGDFKIGEFVFGTDGGGADKLIVRTGGHRYPNKLKDVRNDENGNIRSSDHLFMDGENLFAFMIEKVPELIHDVLKKNDIIMEDVDEFVFHQVNKFLLTSLRKLCGIDKDKFYINVQQTGNTVSSSVPIALKDYLESGGQSEIIMLAGFGVGLSWAGCILKK